MGNQQPERPGVAEVIESLAGEMRPDLSPPELRQLSQQITAEILETTLGNEQQGERN